MEGEATWLKGVFKRLFHKKKSRALTSPVSSSPTGSFRSAIEGDYNLSFIRDTPEIVKRAGPSKESIEHIRLRESRSLSPNKLRTLSNERRKSLKPIIKDTKEGGRSRPKNRVTIDVEPSESPSREQRSCSEERAEQTISTVEVGGIGKSVPEQRLETLIRDRGYHVKKHIPKKVLEERIMGNIRRRERIAIMMRNEAAEAAGCTNTITSADELAQNIKPISKPKVSAPPQIVIDPMRLQHVLGLVSKVWTKRGDKSDNRERPTNRVSFWARQEFIEDCLKSHNKFRELHGAPPLTLCEQLTDEAQSWANHIAETNVIEFSTKDGRGENIMTTTTARGGLTGTHVTNSWYEKGRQFNYNVIDSADLAHASSFTQVIWHNTEKLGVGMTRGEEGRVVAVARYSPKGNIPGQIKTNVLPPLQVNPFDLNSVTKTREEANLNVQTALIAPEVCHGVAKRLNRQIMVDMPKVKMKTTMKLLGVKPPLLIPNGRLLTSCCGPPSALDAEVNVTPKPSVRETLQVLSPSNLASSDAYQNYNPGSRSESHFNKNAEKRHSTSDRLTETHRKSSFRSTSAKSSCMQIENPRTVTVQPNKSTLGSLAPS